jgi:hypothetical protein
MIFLPLQNIIYTAVTAAVQYKNHGKRYLNQTYKTGANGLPLGFCGLPVDFFLDETALTTV